MIEARVFRFLEQRSGGAALCEACTAMPYACESIRDAFRRLRRQELVGAVKSGTATLYFRYRDAIAPTDERGRTTRKAA